MRLQAAIFDWAGTTVDHGSLAPVKVILNVFERRGVTLSASEARRDMGLLKRDHIGKIFASERVRQAWQVQHGRVPAESDADALHSDFLEMQSAVLAAQSDVIPGIPEAVIRLRQRGIRIGSTTGYTRDMLRPVLEKAATQGYSPDCSVCPDEVGGGRPHPWMCFSNAIQLRLENLYEAVKVGDTEIDVAEGLRAGMWSVGVTRTGNLIGLSLADWMALDHHEKSARLETARGQLIDAGAHYVVETVAEIDTVTDDIDQRLARGERP